MTEAAQLIGVSDDTIRRWAADGSLEASTDHAGVQVVSGRSLAAKLTDRAPSAPEDEDPIIRSARNRFTGLVTAVKVDGIMAQVELQCGPHRVVSTMTSEALEELGLEVGSRATATTKASMITVETRRH